MYDTKNNDNRHQHAGRSGSQMRMYVWHWCHIHEEWYVTVDEAKCNLPWVFAVEYIVLNQGLLSRLAEVKNVI